MQILNVFLILFEKSTSSIKVGLAFGEDFNYKSAETYLDPFQITMMELVWFTNCSNIDVCQGSEVLTFFVVTKDCLSNGSVVFV